MDYFVGEIFEIPYFKTVWSTIASVGWYIIGITICIWWASPVYFWEKICELEVEKE